MKPSNKLTSRACWRRIIIFLLSHLRWWSVFSCYMKCGNSFRNNPLAKKPLLSTFIINNSPATWMRLHTHREADSCRLDGRKEARQKGESCVCVYMSSGFSIHCELHGKRRSLVCNGQWLSKLAPKTTFVI